MIENIYNKFNELFQEMSRVQTSTQESWEREASSNNSYFRREISNFYVSNTSNFKELRNDLKNLQQQMKGIKLNRDDREYIFNRLNELFQELHTTQDQVYKAKQREWQDRLRSSISKLEGVIQRLKESITYDENKLYDMQYKIVPNKWLYDHNQRMDTIRDKVYSKKEKIKDMNDSLYDMKSKLV